MVGRYVGDQFDGDSLTSGSGNPWVVCTCSFAQLYYELAQEINNGSPVPNDSLSHLFFSQIGINVTDPAHDLVAALRAAGDYMLNAITYHSIKLELSEQLDGITGFERGAVNLSWSYAAYLSAVAARGGL